MKWYDSLQLYTRRWLVTDRRYELVLGLSFDEASLLAL